MSFDPQSNDLSRQRLLMIAHSFDAKASMESRLSWIRACKAAEEYDTTVICAEPCEEVVCDVNPKVPGLKVVTVAHNRFEKLLMKSPVGFYLAYRLWHLRVLETAREINERKRFLLVHQVSYCGYREPGYCWQLGIPFVWGPIGGTQNVPWRFLTQLRPTRAIKETFRSLVNLLQLKFGRRVGQALQASSAVYVASREIQETFRRFRGLELPCQIETGVEVIADQGRELRDTSRPLRVLWVGRLEYWKALPLLLKAVAKLPPDVDIELRVLGSGSQESRWKKLVNQLKLSNHVEFVALPDCGARDEHYQWADVFAFTSLRDTSGTGLLESLAMGVPILGLDHQGARDIMTSSCAVSIPVKSPQQVISGFRVGLIELAQDAERLQQLSLGAVQRAGDFHWDHLGEKMLACYASVACRHGQVPIGSDLKLEVAPANTSSVMG